MTNIRMYLKHLKHLIRHRSHSCYCTFWSYRNIHPPLQEMCVETKRASQSQKEEKSMMPSREENHGLTSTSHHASKQISLLFLSWQIRINPQDTHVCCALRASPSVCSMPACRWTTGRIKASEDTAESRMPFSSEYQAFISVFCSIFPSLALCGKGADCWWDGNWSHT